MVAGLSAPFDYKPGSILRIRMHNFLTYADAEVRPGPRLNVVVGPNGSGKSTILCALALGLGSQAGALERGDGVGCFVMRDKEKGWVELELKGMREGDENIVIRRDLERASNRSSYRMDGAPATQALVHEKVQELGIYVNNLCTFLPQEKVGKFTEMDPEKLLMETEKVVRTEGMDLFGTHEGLIRRQRALKTCDVKREACEKELKRLVERREGLRGDKEKMEEKDRLKQRADALNKCYKWISFRKNQKMAIQLRAEKQEKEAELEAAGVSMTPFTSRSEGLRALGQNREAAVAEGGALWKKSRAKVARAEGKVEAASDLVMTRSAEAEALEQKRGELERSRAKSQLDLSQALEAGAVDVSALKEEMSSLVGRMRDAKRAQEESARVAHALRRDLVEVNREVYDSEQRLQAMTNKESQRFNRLRSSRMPNARTACEVRAWLEHNRGKFTGRVFGPLILEVSVEDEGIAAIVEQQCLPHVQLTFVVENDHDQKLLLSEWKEGRRANIVVQQLQEHWQQDLRRELYSVSDLRELSMEGISGILLHKVKAPHQVLSALCTQANIDRVLIGDDQTEGLIAHGLMEKLCRRGVAGQGGAEGGSAVVYTQRKDGVIVQHRGTVSRYSGKLSTQSRITRQSELLGLGGTDQEVARERAHVAREIEARITSGKEKAAELQAQIRDAEEVQNTAGREATQLYKEHNKMQQQLKQAKEAHIRIKRIKTRLEEIETELNKDVGQERAELVAETCTAAKCYLDVLSRHTDEVVAVMARWESNVGPRMTQALIKPLLRGADAELQAESQRYDGLKAEVELKNKQFRELVDHIRETKGTLENDFPLKGPKADPLMVDLLGSELADKSCEECQELYEETLERADRIYDNPAVLQQYKELVKQVTAREEELAEHTGTCSAGQRKVDDLSTKWTAALRPLVAKLHLRFAEYMRQMGCEGEVVLAEEADDFERWGLVLRVRFRKGTTLQPLQAKVQSGGERSVSTILFLMSLQSTVSSPFRAVDEINQGMDERNERLVFSRIVANSTHLQYFLVTPKLLPGLTAMEKEHVTILFVFNAPELLPFDKWNVKDFIKAARKRAGAEDASGDRPHKSSRMASPIVAGGSR